MTRPRILSGMRPTGPLHLGHLTGALDNWRALQDTYDCFFVVVDWHALTTDYANPAEIRQNVLEVTIDWLAAGLDPRRSTLFIQSLVPEHAELHLLLSMITPVSWLERVPSYKEQQQQIHEKDLSTYGFLGYPLLQSADIMIYKADAVPVGEDQVPHIELTREVVRRFNNFYGAVFPAPKTLLTATPRIPGTDGRKMSKSYGNAVYFKDPPEVVGCRTAGIGCLDCKGRLLDHLLHRLEEIHERRPEYASRPDEVWDILAAGSKRARETARATMEEVRSAMKIRYPIS